MSDQQLTLVQHLGELRKRLFISVLALLVGSAVSFGFFKQIIDILVRPARDLGGDAGAQLIYIEVTELLTTSVKVSFVGGFILASPVILSTLYADSRCVSTLPRDRVSTTIRH